MMKRVWMLLMMCLAGAASAEPLFVSLMEVDDLRSASSAIQTFAARANCPSVQDDFDRFIVSAFSVPYDSWLDTTKTLRIVRTVDPDRGPAEDNPGLVVFAPMMDKGQALVRSVTRCYSRQLPVGTFGLIYKNAISKELPPAVAMAVDGRTVLIARTAAMLEWGWRNRNQFIRAPAQKLNGTFRLLVNGPRYAELLPILHPNVARYPVVASLLRQLPTAVMSTTFDQSTFGFAISATPEPKSRLAQQLASVSTPSPQVWNSLDSDRLLTMAACNAAPSFVDAYASKQLAALMQPFDGLLPATAFAGEVETYFDRIDGSRYVWGTSRAVSDAPGVQAKLPSLSTNPAPGVEWTPLPKRTSAGVDIFRWSLKLSPKFAVAGHHDLAFAQTLLMTILRTVVLEAAVRDGRLVTSLSSGESLEKVWEFMRPLGSPRTLDKILSIGDPCLRNEKISAALSISPTRALRAAVEAFPGVTEDRLRGMVSRGSGATMGLVCAEKGRTLLSLRLAANEISAIQEINDRVSPLLQDIFFQIFANNAAAAEKKKE